MPADAANLSAKLDAAKRADRDGYSPHLLARSAAGLLTEIEPNDTPASAQAVLVGDTVDATVAVDDIDWFSVDATGVAYLALSTSPVDGSATDTVLEVYAGDGTTLIGLDDDGGLGLFSALLHLEVPADGQVLVRVTRFGPVGDEAYRLSVEVGSMPPATPANDTPATALFFESCNTATMASTVGAGNAVDAMACVGFDPLGGDLFYRFELAYSFQLSVIAEVTGAFDPSLYLFTDPNDPQGSCVAGIDEAFAGDAETLIYINEDESSPSMVLYLGVDTWDPGRPGSFTLLMNCDFVVPIQTTSFGGFKARF